VGNSDFKQRIERINKSANQRPVEDEVKKVRLAPQSSGIGKYLWGVFGAVWGLIATVMMMFANANYDRALADTETPEMFVIVVATGAFGLFSMAIFALLLGLSFTVLRKYQGLRLLVMGFGAGLVVGAMASGLA
jgi:hypothetical protein